MSDDLCVQDGCEPAPRTYPVQGHSRFNSYTCPRPGDKEAPAAGVDRCLEQDAFKQMVLKRPTLYKLFLNQSVLQQPPLHRPLFQQPVFQQPVLQQPSSLKQRVTKPAVLSKTARRRLSRRNKANMQPVIEHVCSTPPMPFPFLKLPRELRQMILRLAIDTKVLDDFEKSLGV